MADLIVKRSQGGRDLFRRYAIEIDGAKTAYVGAGRTTHVKITEGIRKVRFLIDGYSSRCTTVLASNQCVAIMHCTPAENAAATPLPGLAFRFAPNLPRDRTSYITAELDGAPDLARAFLRAAWSVARFQIQERTKPGEPSRYGLTAGDLSTLCQGCRMTNTSMITSLGAANDHLWSELARVGWLKREMAPRVHSKAVAFCPTEIGRMELLEIFS